jgi:hypothetical protein
MSDEDIQSVMSLVPPLQGSKSASSVDNEYLRRAIGVAVAMAGERSLDHIMAIYEREHIFLVREPLLRDIVELEISWFFDALWDWAKETGKRLQPTGVAVLREVSAGRAYVTGRTLKLWETARTTEDKLAAISRMIDFGLPQFLDALAAALEEPSLMIQAMTALERNCSRLWTEKSDSADLQKKALLSRKVFDIHKTIADQKIRDCAKKTYFALIFQAKNVDAVFSNAKQVLEKAETEEASRVLFIYVLGQLYKDTIAAIDHGAAIKNLVGEAMRDSREAVKFEAEATMKIIERRDNPPKYKTPDWVENR